MSIGQAYSEALTPREQKTLQSACDILIDHALDDLKSVADAEDVSQTIFGVYLPQRYLPKYTYLFLKQFTVCIIMVAWKLALSKKVIFSSVAEELAAWAIIQQAELIMEAEGAEDVKNAFGNFIDVLFEDTSVELLYDDMYDGMDQTNVGEHLGMTSLYFDDWFKPLSDHPSRIAHPYVVE